MSSQLMSRQLIRSLLISCYDNKWKYIVRFLHWKAPTSQRAFKALGCAGLTLCKFGHEESQSLRRLPLALAFFVLL